MPTATQPTSNNDREATARFEAAMTAAQATHQSRVAEAHRAIAEVAARFNDPAGRRAFAEACYSYSFRAAEMALGCGGSVSISSTLPAT
jgi:hypothetical protein